MNRKALWSIRYIWNVKLDESIKVLEHEILYLWGSNVFQGKQVVVFPENKQLNNSYSLFHIKEKGWWNIWRYTIVYIFWPLWEKNGILSNIVFSQKCVLQTLYTGLLTISGFRHGWKFYIFQLLVPQGIACRCFKLKHCDLNLASFEGCVMLPEISRSREDACTLAVA